MKVYLAKDWLGPHIFLEPPRLEKCGGLPEFWCGHRLKGILNETLQITEEDIPRGKYLEHDLCWSLVHSYSNTKEI
jgi:hypothetical protein